MKKIAVGDLGEFYYGDFKEPFVQLEGANEGYPQGMLLTTPDGSGRLLCPYCRDETKPSGQRGRSFDNLAAHASFTHGMNARAFKREVGLLQTSALISEPLRQKRTAHALRRFRQGLFRRVPPPARPSGRHEIDGWGVPEHLNRTGRCYAQVVAVARAIVAETGHLTEPSLARRGIWPKTIGRYFGDLNELRKLVAAPIPKYSRASPEELLRVLRSLAVDLGRTPTIADAQRYGLPSSHTYARQFGTYAKACQRAGLDVNLPHPALDKTGEVAIVTAYATHGTVERVCGQVNRDHATVVKVLAKYGIASTYLRTPSERAERRGFAADIARRLADWPEAVHA